MAHRQYADFHEGNRSEYLAHFVLSSFAAVSPVPRQEDYGLDFNCSLTRRSDDGSLYVEEGFGVQVKSEGIRKVTFGGMSRASKTKPSEWKRWEPKWLFHQDNPLFVALVSKKEWRVKLYSTTRMWGAQWLSGGPHVIHLIPNKEQFDGPPPDHRFSEEPGPADGVLGRGVWQVALGKPILDIAPAQLEEPEFRTTSYQCIKDWIQIDRRNLLHHSVGIPFTIEPQSWTVNERPTSLGVGGTYQNATPGMNVDRILSSIVPAVVSLKANFAAQGQTAQLSQLTETIKLLEGHRDQLDQVAKSVLDVFG